MQKYAQIHLPFSDLRYDECPSNCSGRRVKIADFSYVFHSTLRHTNLIGNWRTGGNSMYSFAFLFYVLLLGVMNI